LLVSFLLQKGSVLNKNIPEPVPFEDSGSRSPGAVSTLLPFGHQNVPKLPNDAIEFDLEQYLQRYFFLKIN